MTESIVRLIWLVVGLVVTGVVVLIVWSVLADTAEKIDTDGGYYDDIEIERICDAAGGDWNEANDPPCAAP